MPTTNSVRETVRARYGAIAKGGKSCCSQQSLADIGYRAEELDNLPESALMGLGCGNPVGPANLQPGETVVDLGSGGGLDVILAAKQVGEAGRVIGVDMTPEMVERAQSAATRLRLTNVEFRLGLIEALPLPDASADVVMSNCVINLAPDKQAVFREAFRVLKRNGRLTVSDEVARAPLPAEIRESADSWASCVGGAIPESEYLEALRLAGFADVTVLARADTRNGPVYSVTVRARKT